MTTIKASNNQKKIVVVGSINCDQTAYLERFPKINQTVFAKKSSLSVGGKGLNQAVSAASLGGNVSMVSCIGNDVFGEMATVHLQRNQINQEHIRITENVSTGSATIYVTEEGENMIAVTSGANNELSPIDIEEKYSVIADADVLIVQLEVPIETVKMALQVATEAKITTILNPAPMSKNITDLIKLSTVITPNETEVEALVGIYPKNEEMAALAALKLNEYGAREIIITMGDKGYYISSEKIKKLFPSFPVDVIDPTGAGDVFNGALAVALANEFSLEKSAQFASAAAALSVTKRTAQGSAPSWAQTIEFLRLNKIEFITC
tara:strand:+ start:70 stop:1035 length:966 start_codon:yes stop_codon:yes gene_type:complete